MLYPLCSRGEALIFGYNKFTTAILIGAISRWAGIKEDSKFCEILWLKPNMKDEIRCAKCMHMLAWGALSDYEAILYNKLTKIEMEALSTLPSHEGNCRIEPQGATSNRDGNCSKSIVVFDWNTMRRRSSFVHVTQWKLKPLAIVFCQLF